MNVYIDIDDTMNNLTYSISKYLAIHVKRTYFEIEQKMLSTSRIERIFPEWDRHEVTRFFARYGDRIYGESRPKDKYLQTCLEGMKKRNMKMNILTHRNNSTESSQRTMKWLIKYNLHDYFNNIYFSNNNGEIISKLKYVKSNNLKIDVMIEDKLEIAEEFAKAGVNVVLFNYPHNQQGYTHPKIKRVNNWWEVYQVLCQLQQKEDMRCLVY